jgi:hypothetical protein
MDNERRWHYVKPNETTNVPRRLIFLDTESFQDRTPFGQTQSWALAVACFRSQRPDRAASESWGTYDDPEILWKEIDTYVGKSGRTVLWTHNLGYDARIAEVFDLLPAMGFTLVAHNLIGKGCWLMWRRGRASLTMVDSTSVFPCELIRLGVHIGLPKLPLPPASARGIGLYSRCWRDVEILRGAVLAYLDWLEKEDLGNWQLTGAGQSWATFRHRFMDRRLLIHDDTDAIAAERRAMWTGRCEAYWHGALGFQVVHEWDLSLAYPRIARDHNVPVRLLGPMPDGFEWRKTLGSMGTALLAECQVVTAVPVVPTHDDGRILWPVGTFTTTLWDVEIQAAIDAGASVTVTRGWLYRKGPALKTWAEWIIAQLDNLKDLKDHWLYIVLKHWARALIGRFAMTYTKWEPYCETPTPMVRAHSVFDAETGETFRTVQIGHTMWRDVGVREWGESMPMITGYIQAIARVRLWTILCEAPEGAVLYCDTDSVLVTDMHSVDMQAVADAHPEWGLRLKRSWQGFAVWGPRQIVTGESVRIAGVPSKAQRVEPRVFRGEVWESLQGAILKGHPGSVHIRNRTWEVRGKDRRRDGPELGWTMAFHLPHTEPGKVTTEEESRHEPPGGHGTDARGAPGRGQDGEGAPGGADRQRGRDGRTGDPGKGRHGGTSGQAATDRPPRSVTYVAG